MAESFGIVIDSKMSGVLEPEPNYDIYALPVDREELRLIKIGLFELSEYLGSPRLALLRQRVNSLLNSASDKKSKLLSAAELREISREFIKSANTFHSKSKESE